MGILAPGIPVAKFEDDELYGMGGSQRGNEGELTHSATKLCNLQYTLSPPPHAIPDWAPVGDKQRDTFLALAAERWVRKGKNEGEDRLIDEGKGEERRLNGERGACDTHPVHLTFS